MQEGGRAPETLLLRYVAMSTAAEIHEQARERWGSLKWSLQAYTQHRSKRSPRYPMDHYLGGAAGYRLDEAWSLIETELGDTARNILRGKPLADSTPEDSWADAVAKAMEDQPDSPPLEEANQKPSRLIIFEGRTKLLDYLLLFATRRAIQRHRKMKPRLATDLSSTDPKSRDAPEPAFDPPGQGDPTLDRVLKNEEDQQRRKLLQKSFAQMGDDTKALLRLVHIEGLKQIDAAEVIGLSTFQVNRRLKQAVRKLRAAANEAD